MIRWQREENRLKSVLPGLPVRMALVTLRFYKTYLSILFAGNCRFAPTCSQYAYQAIARFGVLRGVWLGWQRLLRCHPLSRKFGYDPVPEKWNSFSARLETTDCDLPISSRAAAGFHESRRTSHESPRRRRESLHSLDSGNFEIQDEVHS